MQPQSFVPVQQFGQYYPTPPTVQQHQTDLHRQSSGGHGRTRSIHAPSTMAPPPAPVREVILTYLILILVN